MARLTCDVRASARSRVVAAVYKHAHSARTPCSLDILDGRPQAAPRHCTVTFRHVRMCLAFGGLLVGTSA